MARMAAASDSRRVPASRRRAGTPEFWLVPQVLGATADFNAARDWLAAAKSPIRLESVDGFLLLAETLSAPAGQNSA